MMHLFTKENISRFFRCTTALISELSPLIRRNYECKWEKQWYDKLTQMNKYNIQDKFTLTNDKLSNDKESNPTNVVV